jgi:neutral trehalase
MTEAAERVPSLDDKRKDASSPLVLTWMGIAKHGYSSLARGLIYQWLQTTRRNTVDDNSTLPEKLHVVWQPVIPVDGGKQ